MARLRMRGAYWYARIRDVDGAWRWLATGYRSEQLAEAQSFRDAAQGEADRRRAAAAAAAAAGTPAPCTLAEYADMWIARRREILDTTRARFEATGTGPVECRGVSGYASILRRHILPALGSTLLSDLRAAQARRWYANLRVTTPYARTYRRKIWQVLAVMVADAHAEGVIEVNPLAGLRSRTLGDPVDDLDRGAGRYSAEDIGALLGAPGVDPTARTIVALAYYTGARPGEVGGMRWADIDVCKPPFGAVTIARSWRGPTKTGTRKTLPIAEPLAEVLRAWRHTWGSIHGRPPVAGDYVVPAPPDPRFAPARMLTRVGIRRLVRSALAAAGVVAAAWPVHAFRSTLVSVAEERGANIEDIERITHPRRPTRAFDRYRRGDSTARVLAVLDAARVTPTAGASIVPLGTNLGTAPGADGRSVAILGAYPEDTGGRRRTGSSPPTPSTTLDDQPNRGLVVALADAAGPDPPALYHGLVTTTIAAVRAVADRLGVVLPAGFADELAAELARGAGSPVAVPLDSPGRKRARRR